MASSGGSGHGGKRSNSGRKRKVEDRGEYKKAWLRNHKRIYVEEKIFKLWLQAKFEHGLFLLFTERNAMANLS